MMLNPKHISLIEIIKSYCKPEPYIIVIDYIHYTIMPNEAVVGIRELYKAISCSPRILYRLISDMENFGVISKKVVGLSNNKKTIFVIQEGNKGKQRVTKGNADEHYVSAIQEGNKGKQGVTKGNTDEHYVSAIQEGNKGKQGVTKGNKENHPIFDLLNEKVISLILENHEKVNANIEAWLSEPQKTTKKSPSKTKKESSSLYPRMMKVYHDWFSDRNDGLPPNINMPEGAALKKIIAYFEPLVIKKAASNGVILEKGTLECDNEVVNAFSLIFNQWHKMDAFIQGGVKLAQINSNLTNIINTIKNGNSKLTKQEKHEQILERDRQEWINIANKLNDLQ